MNEEVDQTPAGKELSLLLHARKCSIYLQLYTDVVDNYTYIEFHVASLSRT